MRLLRWLTTWMATHGAKPELTKQDAAWLDSDAPPHNQGGSE